MLPPNPTLSVTSLFQVLPSPLGHLLLDSWMTSDLILNLPLSSLHISYFNASSRSLSSRVHQSLVHPRSELGCTPMATKHEGVAHLRVTLYFCETLNGHNSTQITDSIGEYQVSRIKKVMQVQLEPFRS